jgi:ubiquinone/menaquinone biosynthesis C-methylase UbiE
VTVADVQRRYDDDADAYIRWWAPVLRTAMQPVLDGVDWSSASRVFEIGCGTGILLEDIVGRAPAARVIGVDASYGMLRHASRVATLVQADAQRLPMTDAAADVMVSGFMLQHVPEPRVVFAEWARCLRPNGQLTLAAWVGTSGWPAEQVYTEELDAVGAPQVPSTRTGGGATDSTDKLVALAEAAGLVVDSTVVRPLQWSPTVDEVVGQLSSMRTTGRRTALLAPEQAAALRERVRERLNGVPLYADDVCHLLARRPP